MRVTVAATDRAFDALGPLTDCWSVTRRVPLHRGDPGPAALQEWADGADALLVVGDRRRSPRTVLPGPVVTATDGRTVPVSWMPALSSDRLGAFARACAGVHARPTGPRTVAVLGQRLGRYDDLAGRIVRTLGTSGIHARAWTSYDVHRDDLVARLGRGPAAAVYVGHARPTGWCGYAGLRARHFTADEARRPAAAILSLTCHTASRRRTSLSFAEALVGGGICAATVGAVGSTLHSANARWALRLATEVASTPTIGALVATAAAADPYASAYRLIGDPTAPLADDPDFARTAPLPTLEVA